MRRILIIILTTILITGCAETLILIGITMQCGIMPMSPDSCKDNKTPAREPTNKKSGE
jgi:hypothetical protein